MNKGCIFKVVALIALSGFSAASALAGRAPASASGTRTILPSRFGAVADCVRIPNMLQSYRDYEERRGIRRDFLPSKYDSRDFGWVTSVKNQGGYGTCWAHATMASLETALMKHGDTDGEEEWDLSENHLANLGCGFALDGFYDGGNNLMSAARLLSWDDPLRETDDPYPDYGSEPTGETVRHVQNIVWLPSRVNIGEALTNVPPEIAEYKTAVKEYGAAAVGYLHVNSCFAADGAYFLPSAEYNPAYDGGHLVTMVGWDDNFPSNRFVHAAPGNGAILCKNSWGEVYGDDGYIWISYYDSGLFYLMGAAYPALEATTNYGRVYEYDPCGFCGAYNVYEDGDEPGSKTNWCANIFHAEASGVVEAVGFYSLAAGTEYELRVYKNCSDDDPTSGTLASQQSGTFDCIGYKTFTLATPVTLDSRGESFSVVVKFSDDVTEYPIPVEMSVDNYCYADAESGQSFLSGDGENWTDFKKISFSYGDENICLKAYMRAGSEGDDSPRIWYVDASAAAESADGSEEHPFPTINEAIDCAWTDDTVLVAPGVYRETVKARECLKEIRSIAGAEVTIIDGEGKRRCYYDNTPRYVQLTGFTLTGGYSTKSGGGAYSAKLSHCVVSNCVVYSKSGNAHGGGVTYSTCDNTLLVDNRVEAPNGYAYGGGASSSVLINCTVADNAAEGATALAGGAYQGFLYNSIVAYNSVVGVDVAAGADVYSFTSDHSFIGGDPGFVDRERRDYHLANGSPCVDAGLLSLCDTRNIDGQAGDLDGEERVRGWEIDQGCYEYSQEVWFRDWTLYAGGVAHTNALVIYADGDWELACDCDWLTPLELYGTGCATVKVEVAANTSAAYRTASIYLSGAGVDYIDWCDFYQAARTARGEKHYGLFVGINEYTMSGATTLHGCVNDATNMLLRAMKSGLWHADRTTLLTNSCATAANIRAAIADIASQAVAGDTVLYYHSGHGAGTDYGEPTAVGLCAHDAFYYDSELATDLADFADGVKIVVIADTCHSGGLYKTNAWTKTGRQFVERMSELVSGPAFVAAVDYNNNSIDDPDMYPDGGYGGVFTASLVEGWRTGAADADGDSKLNFLELAQYATARAYGLHSRLGDEPQCWNEMTLSASLAGYVPGVWPEPEIASGDDAAMSAEKVRDAMIGAGFSDAAATAITNESAFAALQAWETATGVTLASHAASPTAILSAALGAAELLEVAPEDVAVAKFDAAGDLLQLEVSLEVYDRLKANAELLAAAIGVVGADTPDGQFSSAGLSVAVTPAENTVRLTITRPDAAQYFFKPALR